MDIKILDSWLREHLETKAKPKDIAKALSLTSASIEKIEDFNNDYLYHIEVTTNRVDMASVIGIAREAAAVLPQFGFEARVKPSYVIANQSELVKQSRGVIVKTTRLPRRSFVAPRNDVKLDIVNNDKLVKRISCVILEITQKESPQYIKDRLESAGIRSLNNIIDITNYVMLEIGHPTHAFDYDRLTTKKLIVRQAKKGEKVVTLDRKEHTLLGGDIVADNGKGEIVDLLGVMGTLNSVVTNKTTRILFFIDNNDPVQIRKTSMSLGIRTEAASINEKDVDPELAMPALLRGIELYQQVADAKIISEIIDIYPKKWKAKTITVDENKINQVIGVEIQLKQASEMLERLGFAVVSLSRGRGIKGEGKNSQNRIEVTIPSFRDADMNIAEDVIEEIARMYGYHNLPSKLPPSEAIIPYQYTNEFFWEQKVKEALKYWGFTEVYTYSMVSETLLDGPITNAITLKNPLDEDHIYMRKNLTPSLLEVMRENKQVTEMKIFEIANVYHKKLHDLPDEIRMLAGIVKGSSDNFFSVKGILEQLATDLGITHLVFGNVKKGGMGTTISLGEHTLGEIEVLDEGLLTFEVNFSLMEKQATLKKVYKPIAKFPPIIEDMSFVIDASIQTGDIIDEIKKHSSLISEVSLLDQYEDKRTFHIIYQAKERNLTNEEIGKIREKIITTLQRKFSAKLK